MNVDFDICWEETKIGEIAIQLFSSYLCVVRIETDFVLGPIGLKRLLFTRRIPATRYNQNIFNMLQRKERGEDRIYEFMNVAMILNYGLSLTDPIWLVPKKELRYGDYFLKKANYGDLNFFENSFSMDIGKILFSNPYKYYIPDSFAMYSPDLTTGGDKNKRWEITNEGRFLHKRYEWLDQRQLSRIVREKEEKYIIAKRSGVSVPQQIEKTDFGWRTRCICNRGDFLLSNEQIREIMYPLDLENGKIILCDKFMVPYSPSGVDGICGLLITAEGNAYDVIW